MKMGSKSGSHMVDLLFTLALFCVFAASALMVVLIGANVYKSTVEQMDENFGGRTSLTYVATKIRQNDLAGGIRVTELGGVPALVLDQTVEGAVYQTWIYHYDGALREVFVSAENAPTSPDGDAIIEVADFSIEQRDGSLVLSSVDHNGRRTTQTVTPRCGV